MFPRGSKALKPLVHFVLHGLQDLAAEMWLAGFHGLYTISVALYAQKARRTSMVTTKSSTARKAMPRTSIAIRDDIQDDIVTSKLPSGTKLDEAGLCARFKVSRTLVREALRFLAERGLVELIRHRGAFVAEVSMARLIEMFEVMAELEGMAGRLSARRMTVEQHAALRKCHRACRMAATKKNPDDYYYHNEAFHDAIVAGSNNTFLTQQLTALRRRLAPYRRMQLRVARRMRDSFDEHQQIVDAIVAANEHEAESLLRKHVLIQGERFTNFLASLSESQLPGTSS